MTLSWLYERVQQRSVLLLKQNLLEAVEVYFEHEVLCHIIFAP